MVLVSVIIPTYNRAHTLERAIDSVLGQTYRAREVIVVDDGSTDGTTLLLEQYGQRVTALTQGTTRGVSAARNSGVRASRGEYLCFLDSDDEWMPKKLEAQWECQAHGDYALVHTDEIWIRNGRRANPKKIHQKHGGWIFEHCLPRCLISPSSVMVEREAFLSLGGFNEDFPVCEDYDLWLKMACRHKVGFIPRPLIVKYGGAKDQLSRRYRAMDYYRVLSLDNIRKNGPLSPAQGEAASRELERKAHILMKGYLKHGHPEKYREVEQILKRGNGNLI